MAHLGKEADYSAQDKWTMKRQSYNIIKQVGYLKLRAFSTYSAVVQPAGW